MAAELAELPEGCSGRDVFSESTPPLGEEPAGVVGAAAGGREKSVGKLDGLESGGSGEE